MSLLLDTHVVLWWLEGARLSESTLDRISDPAELVVVSAATIWEAAIKRALGKLDVPESLAAAVIDEGFEPLPIGFEHAARAGALPPHHRDPFDRILIAQALEQGLTIATHDPAFEAYGIDLLRV
ncbi:MAG: type II toxin-antitoxin system VapC family toxin [Acidimicrobiia bacterium]